MSSREVTVVVKKRERTQNWIPEEKSALFSLIKSHVNAIENKKIDTSATLMKMRAWQKIHREFQMRFSTSRDITRMKEQWRRMKTQAKTEMFTFAEKLRTLGPEMAAKTRPSSLSMDVLQLLENVRKNDGNVDRSDENNEDTNCLTHIRPSHFLPTGIKLERHDDGYEAELESKIPEQDFGQEDVEVDGKNIENIKTVIDRQTPNDFRNQKRPRIDDDQIENCINGDLTQGLEENEEENEDSCESTTNNLVHQTPIQKEMWLFEATRKEYDLKFKIMHIELEKAELQKQAAFDEWKTAQIKKKLTESQAAEYYNQVRMSGEPGSGAGKGGGGGGTIREAGGAFGKMEAAREDQYFYNQQKEQLKHLREELHDEISFHEEQIKRHQEAINRHKSRISDMDKK